METKDLALAVIKTAEIRENSFNPEPADGMSIAKATNIAIKKLKLDPKLSYLIYLLLICSWNDSLAWANNIEAFEEAFKEEVK